MNAKPRKSVFGQWFVALWVMLGALQPSISAPQWDIDRLMQTLAGNQSGRATFVEKKYIAVLERPVESSGELSYSAPDKLEKKTLKPKPETMQIDGGTMVIERGRTRHTLQLDDYPELAGFVDSIRGTLMGDRKALERSFDLKLDGNAEHWVLVLTPNNQRLAAAVQQIRIAGSGDDVRRVDIMQADGDRSAMVITRSAGQ